MCSQPPRSLVQENFLLGIEAGCVLARHCSVSAYHMCVNICVHRAVRATKCFRSLCVRAPKLRRFFSKRNLVREPTFRASIPRWAFVFSSKCLADLISSLAQTSHSLFTLPFDQDRRWFPLYVTLFDRGETLTPVIFYCFSWS